MDNRKTVIKVDNLTVRYKEKDIWKGIRGERYKRGMEDISFEVRKGEVFSIIGLNGAGKTSTMKCILGLIDPDEGRVSVFGKNKLKSTDFERIGYLPEISYYPKSMRLKDLMMYYCELYNMPKSKAKIRIEEVLTELGIYGRINDRLEGFSKGMLQKVGLAQAVINDPEILFLDEPMSGLDPLARQGVVDLIKSMRDRGTTVFFNTHILADVADIGDRIAIIHEGKLVEVISMEEMRREHTYKMDIEVCEGDGQCHTEVVSKEELNDKLEELIKKGDRILHLEREEFSLKEYFIGSIGGAENE